MRITKFVLFIRIGIH